MSFYQVFGNAMRVAVKTVMVTLQQFTSRSFLAMDSYQIASFFKHELNWNKIWTILIKR